jgi:hypothetical protein
MTDQAAIEPQSEVPPPAGRPMAKLFIALLVLAVIAGGIWILTISSGGGPAKETARLFIDDMRAGNLDAAKSRCTTSADFEKMQRDIKKMDEWGKLVSAGLTARRFGDESAGRYDVTGDLEFANLRKNFNAVLLKQSDGAYKISSYSFD